jgi:hypothetical protein
VFGLAETQPDETLAGGRIELLGSVQEDDVLRLRVDDDLDEDADVDCVGRRVREEGEPSM